MGHGPGGRQASLVHHAARAGGGTRWFLGASLLLIKGFAVPRCINLVLKEK